MLLQLKVVRHCIAESICCLRLVIQLPLLVSSHASCADPGIFVRGVHVNLTKKSSDNVCFFLVLSLFNRSQMVYFKDNYHFSRFWRGSKIFQGGPTFSGEGGSHCLFPITYDFRGGPDPLSPPPLWIRTCALQSFTIMTVSSDLRQKGSRFHCPLRFHQYCLGHNKSLKFFH